MPRHIHAIGNCAIVFHCRYRSSAISALFVAVYCLSPLWYQCFFFVEVTQSLPTSPTVEEQPTDPLKTHLTYVTLPWHNIILGKSKFKWIERLRGQCAWFRSNRTFFCSRRSAIFWEANSCQEARVAQGWQKQMKLFRRCCCCSCRTCCLVAAGALQSGPTRSR